MKCLILLVCLFATTAYAEGNGEGRPVIFSQDTDMWGLRVNATGTVTNHEKTLDVHLDELTFGSNPSNKRGAQIVDYTVCLVYQKTEEAWDKTECARPVKHEKQFSDGEVETIKDVSFSLEKVDKLPLNLFWLVLIVDNKKVINGYMTTFAQSQSDVLHFAAEPAQ